MNPVLTDPPPVVDAASIAEVISSLKRVTPLNGLSDEEYEWLARNGSQRREPSGAVLFHDGDPATRMSDSAQGRNSCPPSARSDGFAFYRSLWADYRSTPLFPHEDVWRHRLHHRRYLGVGVRPLDVSRNVRSHPEHGAAVRRTSAGPSTRDYAHGAADGEARRFGKVGGQSCPRAQ